MSESHRVETVEAGIVRGSLATNKANKAQLNLHQLSLGKQHLSRIVSEPTDSIANTRQGPFV